MHKNNEKTASFFVTALYLLEEKRVLKWNCRRGVRSIPDKTFRFTRQTGELKYRRNEHGGYAV